MKKIISVMLALCMLVTAFQISAISASAAIVKAGGQNETLFAEWDDSDPAAAEVKYKPSDGSEYLSADKELIRAKDGTTARVDIPGLKAGNYDIMITASDGTSLSKTGVEVSAYDRSGYAHFNYNEGVGAYNDDGTLKSKAKVVYVTNENKDTIELPFPDGSGSVKGIGNILNSRGAKGSSEGLTNINDDILRKYAQAGIPLDFRFVGRVTPPAEGLTAFDSVDYGGSLKDNGFMARMKDAKDITIEGIGYDAAIEGWGIHFMASSAYPDFGKSFEVRNLTFEKYPEDALGMEGIANKGYTPDAITAPVERCWIHNNSFLPGFCANPKESDKKEGDGSCDFKRGMYYTLSYNYFENCHKTNLIGASDDNPQFHITFHHNFWKDCGSRMPLLRTANIHIYNNYFSATPGGKDLSKTVDARSTAYALSEANYFEGSKNPILTKNSAVVKSYGDIFYNTNGDNTATIVKTRTETVKNDNAFPDFDTNPSVFYYNALTKESDCILTDAVTAKAECIAYSGVMKETPQEPVEEPVITAVPENAVPIGYSISYNKEDAGARMTAAGVANLRGQNNSTVVFENVLYNLASDFKPSSSNPYIKSKGANVIVFRLDEPAKVTVKCAEGAKLGIALYDSYGKIYMNIPTGQEREANVPAGIYTIQCENTTKEAFISGFSISEQGDIEEPVETSTEARVVEIGTYNVGTKYADETVENSNDCTDVAGTFGNITYDLRSISSDYGILRNDGESGIYFNADKKMSLTTVTEGKGIIITADSGRVNDQTSVTLSPGTNTVTIYAGSYTITGADESGDTKISKLVFEEYKEPDPSTQEPSTEESTESVPVELGTPAGSGEGCSVVDNGNGTYTLNDNSTTDSCVWTIPFEKQTSGKIIISGNITLNQSSGSWPFLQIRGQKGSGGSGAEGETSEICGFGSSKDTKLPSLHGTDGTYYPLTDKQLEPNHSYHYEFIIDLDNKEVTLKVDKTLEKSCSIDVSSISAVHMQTAVSDTKRKVTADIPYVGILSEGTPTPPDPVVKATGDVDANGRLTANDAAIVLYHSNGGSLRSEWNIKAGDMDGSGDYSAHDAEIIMNMVLNSAYSPEQ